MGESAFISRAGRRPGSKPGGSRPTAGTGQAGMLEFTVMLVRDEAKGPTRPHTLADLPKGPAGHARTMRGLLKWGAEIYEARSQVWSNLALPEGMYLVDGGPRRPGYGGSKGQHGTSHPTAAARGAPSDTFSIPIRPQHGTDGVLSIHADDGRRSEPGIALVGADAAEFWQRWQATPRTRRPGRMWVSNSHGAGGEGGKVPGGSGGNGGKAPVGGRF
jgi:hypothetical protein